MSSTQLSWKWLAGFFDGEGCVASCVQNAGHPAMAIRLYISQSHPQDWVLDDIAKFLEDQFVSVYLRPVGKYGQRDLQISQFDSVEFVLKRLEPHLVVKRERAKECLAYMKEVRKMKKKHGRKWANFVIAPARLRG